MHIGCTQSPESLQDSFSCRLPCNSNCLECVYMQTGLSDITNTTYCRIINYAIKTITCYTIIATVDIKKRCPDNQSFRNYSPARCYITAKCAQADKHPLLCGLAVKNDSTGHIRNALTDYTMANIFLSPAKSY